MLVPKNYYDKLQTSHFPSLTPKPLPSPIFIFIFIFFFYAPQTSPLRDNINNILQHPIIIVMREESGLTSKLEFQLALLLKSILIE